jgi:hypothetical protein
VLGNIFVYLQKIFQEMRINFNTIIYPIYGCLIGINYWDSKMDHVVIESTVEGPKRTLFGITFVHCWYIFYLVF